ncbi:hypothetical protein I2F27_12980 [Acinetobacter sp. B5B]|uniref:hypothetical protein n=1 Tax=Acinetobacter baretiae TaxID=2605383 RepID=UPI0018C2D0AE|nr:hypothetical protein [Acinetobacter baretiae]MBF7684204.1 hypothetical protein [Acinetobacter baretiae]MBF7686575.1 hypothetical protein [Acinetobacter baretiae]
MNKLIALFTVFLMISSIASARTTGILDIRLEVISSCSVSTKPTVVKNSSTEDLVNVLCNQDTKANNNSDIQSNGGLMPGNNDNLPSITKTVYPNNILNITVTY